MDWALGDWVSPLDLSTGGYSQSYELQYQLTGKRGSLLRFLRLVEVVRGLLPGASFDDRFALFDDLDMDRAQRVGAGTGVTVLDGITRFARYSRLLWMERRAPAAAVPE